MFKRIAAICLMMIVVGVYTTAQAQRSGSSPRWIKLATRSLDLRAGRAVFRLGAQRQPMKAIRFRALRRALRLTGVTVLFKDGGRYRIGGVTLKANRNSRTYNLGEGGKLVDKIVVTYKRSNTGLRWIGLQIFGAPAAPASNIIIGKNDPKKNPKIGRTAKFNKKQLQPNRPGTFATRTRRVRQRDGTYRTITEIVRPRKPIARGQAVKKKPRITAFAPRKLKRAAKRERRVLGLDGDKRNSRGLVGGIPSAPKTSRSVQRRTVTRGAVSKKRSVTAARRVERPAVVATKRSNNNSNQPVLQPKRATRSLLPPPPVPADRSPPNPPPMGLETSEPRSAARENTTEEEIDDKEAGTDPFAADKSKDYDIMPVYYGTDRLNKPGKDRPGYTTKRAEKLQLGRALVTVPKTHKMPNVERPWAINIPFWGKVQLQSEDPKKHFTLKELKELKEEDFLRFVRQRIAQSKTYKDQALVFIHGFNNTFDGAIYRTAQIAFDLKFDSAPFLYSWPSAGGLTSYFYDRESATASRPHLRKFLELITKKTGVKSVSIIAHSMGNVALLEVLRDLKNSTPDSVKINQIILAAPDVGVTNFKILAREIRGLANGVTLYASSNDRALDISRQFFGGVPRAGDVPDGGPIVVEGIDTIDVSAVSTDSLSTNHSKYAQTTALMNDIERLLKTGQRPPQARNDQFEIVQKVDPNGDFAILPDGTPARYWRYPAP